MGILNVTPDSFYDGGRFFNLKAAVGAAKEMIRQGADIIDVGGESTGPNSRSVEEKEELRRVIPVIKKIAPYAHKKGAFISIDTYKSEVARQAIEAGADIVNDVTALRNDPKMAEVIAKYNAPVVLMRAKDPTPRTTLKKIRYKDAMKTVKNFLKERADYAVKNGIKKTNIIIDPGMGMFVSAIPKYSFEILQKLPELKKLGFPILVGASRKSFLGGAPKDRLIPSIFTSLYALFQGADIIRVHDIKEMAGFRSIFYNKYP